jgi:Carbohydrate binding domain
VIAGGLAHPAASETGARPAPPLRLQLEPDGAVGSIRVGNRTLPSLPGRGGFSLRTAGNGPNLLPNASFEEAGQGEAPDGWSFTSTGNPPRIDGTVAHDGTRSIRVSNRVKEDSGAFRTEVPIEPNTSYVFSTWFRSRDVRPLFPTAIRETYHPHSPLKVAVEQLAGDRVVSVTSAWGYTGTSDWNRQFAGMRTRGDVSSVRIVGWIEGGAGTGWFDDLYLGRLFPEDPVEVRGTISHERGGRTSLETALPKEGLSLAATFTPGQDHVLVEGAVQSHGTADRAFQVSYSLPVDASGWTWADYARRSTPVRAGTNAYLSTTSLQQVSRYPWGVIHDTESALAVGVPLAQPRVFRIAYDPSAGLSVTFDLAVSSDARALGNRATFSFVVFSADPVWGFRSATQRYYDLFPRSFVRRMNPACEGAWFVAPPLGSIGRTYLDFGLGLDMVALGKASSQSHATWGKRYIVWDERRNIASTAYTHQWAFYDPVGRKAELTYEQAVARLAEQAGTRPRNEEQERLRNEAAAALASTQRDYNGRLYYERFGSLYAYYENLDALPEADPDWPSAVLEEQVDRAIDLGTTARARLDGIHMDSTSGMRRWGAADDYDRRHWAAARIPLTFSYESGLPVVRGIFPMHDHIRELASFVHDRGMLLTANFNATETQTLGFVGADHIDYFGLEQGLADRARPGMSSDQFAMIKRTLAYQRPVSTLDHLIGQGKLGSEEIERRLQQNLFYGMFSGAFDAKTEAEATDDRATWSTSENAKLWALYAPLIKEIAVAGWHPVTDAWSSNSRVWLERFGSLATGDLHLAVRNETGAVQRFSLTVDIASLHADPAKDLRAVEEITGVSLGIAANHSGGVAVLTMSVPPRSTRLLAITETP